MTSHNDINFKYANDFNVFVLENATQYNVECEGRVAIGNNANLVNYNVGTKLPMSTSRDDLVIGGKANIDGGINFSGNTIIGDSNNILKYTMNSSSELYNDPIVKNTIDFESSRTYLREASRFWSSLDDNTNINLNNNTLNLIGEDVYLNIFTIDTSNINNSNICLEDLDVIDIIAPKTSTILINILGEHISFGNFITLRNSDTPTLEDMSLIVFNFPQAKSLYSTELSIKGSLLAPFACGNLYDGCISGNLILDNFEGNIQPKNILFKGDLPEVNLENKTLLTISNTFPTTSKSYNNLGYIYGTIHLTNKNNRCLRCASTFASNIKIELFTTDDLVSPIKYTYSDYSGNYEFKNLSENYYCLRIVPPEGYCISDGYCNNKFSSQTGFSNQIFINASSYNFDVCLSSDKSTLIKSKDYTYSISGIIFTSPTKTSVYSYNSNGLNKVFINLYDNYHVPITSTYSSCNDGVNGFYKFENLKPDIYYLEFIPPKHYSFVKPLYEHYFGSKVNQSSGIIRINLENKDIPHAYVGLEIKY